MMFVELGKNGWAIEELSKNPMIGPSTNTLISLGAKSATKIVNDHRSAIEIDNGFIVSAVIFISSSVGGTILSAFFLPEIISVGASGGIFGYIGACLADIILNWDLVFGRQYDLHDTDYCRKIYMVVFLLSDVAVNFLVGFIPFVDDFTRQLSHCEHSNFGCEKV